MRVQINQTRNEQMISELNTLNIGISPTQFILRCHFADQSIAYEDAMRLEERLTGHGGRNPAWQQESAIQAFLIQVGHLTLPKS
jgi:hypothetical protein